MRGFVSDWGGVSAIGAFSLMILLVLSAQAFPFQGSNGVVNATVYGIMKYEYGDGVYVDISASDVDVYDVRLIDSTNKTYDGNSGPYRSTLHGYPTETEYRGAIRDILLIRVPNNVIIKRLEITPHNSAPFFINWMDMPGATHDDVTLKFYGAAFEPNGMRWLQGNWNLDLNVSNNSNLTEECNGSEFALVDQFGWVYKGEDQGVNEIPPGESLRFNVKVPFVSEISRPVSLLFDGMKLDISSWV
jgi:hypothetical protein